jgi:hypothetical protein
MGFLATTEIKLDKKIFTGMRNDMGIVTLIYVGSFSLSV